MSLESLCVRDAEDWTLAHYQKWSKETKPVNPKGNHPWIFIGKTNAEVEAAILWPPDAKNRLTGKDPDSGKDWRQEEKGMTEDEIVGWQHWLNGHEFDQTLGDSEGQGSLACDSSWVSKSRKTRLNDWTSSSPGLRYSFESKSLLCPPLPFKVIELLFSTSSKTKIWFGTSAQRLSFWNHFNLRVYEYS